MTTIQERLAVGDLQRDTSQVPHRIVDDNYIPAGRYTSQEFHDLERERLWPRVWQVACREEDLPRNGDFMEYTITDYSILVLKTQTGEIKAFHNACTHRATQLGKDQGSFPTGRIVCPFHGWQFNLDIKGHRVSDFPHAIYRAGDLGDFAQCPASGLWILEIQIAHPSRPFGAFYEDLLVAE